MEMLVRKAKHAIKEFRVLTGTYNAECGRNSAATIRCRGWVSLKWVDNPGSGSHGEGLSRRGLFPWAMQSPRRIERVAAATRGYHPSTLSSHLRDNTLHSRR